jgi:hypothetical protein
MKKEIHLPSKLSRILCDIEDKRLASQTLTGFRDAYRDACVDYSVHGLEMPDSLAEYHIQNLEKRYPTEDMLDWHNERMYNAQYDHQSLYDDRG